MLLLLLLLLSSFFVSKFSDSDGHGTHVVGSILGCAEPTSFSNYDNGDGFDVDRDYIGIAILKCFLICIILLAGLQN